MSLLHTRQQEQARSNILTKLTQFDILGAVKTLKKNIKVQSKLVGQFREAVGALQVTEMLATTVSLVVRMNSAGDRVNG